MENFAFRPSFDQDKMANSFFMPTNPYADSFDASKLGFKYDSFASPLFGTQDIAKGRYNPFEGQSFLPLAKEDEVLHENLKTEHFALDGPSFPAQNHNEHGFEMPYSTKLHDYAVDSYRINRSRGPSFHIGRKPSEDFFAQGFDLLFGRNQDQHQRDRGFSIDGLDLQSGLFDFRGNSGMNHALPGGFGAQHDNHYQAKNNHSSHEETSTQGTAAHSINHDFPSYQNPQLKMEQEEANKDDEPNAFQDFEPKNKKKRKLNNNQEVAAGKPNETTIALQIKKSKSEIKSGVKNEVPAVTLKSSKSTIGKPNEVKTPKGKKGANKKGGDNEQVKCEAEDKSTVTSSINVSPSLKKEDVPGIFGNSKLPLLGNFGMFKKPETAQELLGLCIPAEVEECINNSKIFNQIKAPTIKKIGTLTVEERKVKIEKYLEKRKRRTWNKRVNYDCRKKVADNRLRIKGRFVTKDQAFVMLDNLGIKYDPEKITNAEIKELLTEKSGPLIVPKRSEGGELKLGAKIADEQDYDDSE